MIGDIINTWEFPVHVRKQSSSLVEFFSRSALGCVNVV